ncbi:hypothetical protein BH09BAC3_BH09BAC3_06400 [soil metagenome]
MSTRSFVIVAIYLFLTSCATLTSNTEIKANDSFILGNNEHGSFKVVLKNSSDVDLEVYHAPVGGGRHSSQLVKPKKTISVDVDKNTALVINNPSGNKVNVELLVSGDLGLSMGYKNQ